MDNQNQYLHEVAITAIIVKPRTRAKHGAGQGWEYLITRRSPTKRRFPGMWTVPGGKMETSDYLKLPKDTEFYWYNVLERTLRREIKEEVGIDIDNIEYVTSLATIHEDGSPSLVISCMADYVSGEVKLQMEENDQFVWVSLEEAKNYQLLDGIYDELVMVENLRKGSPRFARLDSESKRTGEAGKKYEWQRSK